MAEMTSPDVPADAASAAESDVYRAWVRACDPALLPEAEAATQAVLRQPRRAVFDKPGRHLTDMRRTADGLPRAHRPWFLDMVAHRMLRDVPAHAGRAYKAARDAEHAAAFRRPAAVDPGWRTANALLFARAGALGGPQLAEHHRWLTEHLDAAEADRAFLRFLTAWSRGGGPLPGDLAGRLRRSGKAAGHGPERDAAVLTELLTSRSGPSAPEKLLDAAARLFARTPPRDADLPALLGLFPTGVTDGAPWLRMLAAAGAFAAVDAGRIALPPHVGGNGPQGPGDARWWRSTGPGGDGWTAWLGRFAFRYSHRRHRSGVMAQRMPDELLDLVPRLATWIAADEARGGGPAAPAVLDASWSRYPLLDAELLDACLAAGVPVDPSTSTVVRILPREDGAPARRDWAALDADPVFGARERRDDHADARRRPARGAAPDGRREHAGARDTGSAGPGEQEAASAARLDEEVDAALGVPMADSERWGRFLTGAAERPPVRRAGAHVLRRSGGAGSGVRIWLRGADGAPVKPVYHEAHNAALELSVLSWALTECPVGHPAAARAADLLRAAEDRHWTPGRLLEAGYFSTHGGEIAAVLGALGPGTQPVLPPPEPTERDLRWLRQGEQWDPPGAPVEVFDNGLVLVEPDGHGPALLRTAALADAALADRSRRLLEQAGMGAPLVLLEALAALFGTERGGGSLGRMVARASDTPVPHGRFEADPAASAPALVAEVRTELGVGDDAARLYLQLLTLARPTDRNVRRWNGWTGPARHRAAVAELESRGLVVRDRRPRAGRSVFATALAAPDDWLPLAGRDLPVEAAKLGWYRAGVRPWDAKHADHCFVRLMAPAPLHELFEAAWRWRASTGRA